MIQHWTRISINCEYGTYDVVEEYEEVVARVVSGDKFLELTSTTGNKLTIRTDSIMSIIESGVEILKKVWEFIEELEEIKKNTTQPDWK